MCMMNLAEHCATNSASCAVDDREALAAWVSQRRMALRNQMAELADLSARLVDADKAREGASPSAWVVSAKGDRPRYRREVQSLMSSISACLSLEVKTEPQLV